MNKEQKTLFINNFLDSMKEAILGDVPKMPEEWDGFEIRAYIARAFASEQAKMRASRKAKFNNDCSVLPLKY